MDPSMIAGCSREVYEILGSDTVLHQCILPVERANRTLKTMIAQFCGKNQRTWDEHLKELTFAINSARQESTGYTPAFLNFGREMRSPNAKYVAEMANRDEKDHTEPDTEPQVALHANKLNRFTETYEFVRTRLAQAFSQQSHYYNLRRRDWRCRIGDQVYRREHPLSSAVEGIAAKLAPKYSGPYTVVKVISPVVYNIKDGGGKVFRHVHIKDLKPSLEEGVSEI
ncbi:uncharacterized protein LOC123321871 isoform X1 [Coccinella septempunctata]|uniref:uncharacterized protein LOC123321871 isoform X1 n=1 Tax=Coccinella septempunctata TaxID=41139 RepID=UPI001D081A82|nr:uncharacterized protein LOC123321871 isoform X1 [Coccinella septempunctata]